MTDLSQITEKIEALEARNRRVEIEKAWEVSAFRRITIALGTYFAVSLYLCFLGIDMAWLHAVVPVAGFLLGTMTLGALRVLWVNTLYRPHKQRMRDQTVPPDNSQTS